MTPRKIYYKEDHSCRYDFPNSPQMDQDMRLWMIDMLGGTSDEATSTVIEHWHGTSEAGHVQDMIYFKCSFGGVMDMEWYASTAHDMDKKYSEVIFFALEAGEYDAIREQIKSKGLTQIIPAVH